ncbi:MAG TPA: MotA/TolQ/ExbB proton channel family protein [Verrucomicrobiae bacterium]|jgi:biopolymer transport protein ExbB
METIIMGVLMAASVIGMTFIIERGLALREGKVMPREVKSALASFRATEELPMLSRLCQQHPSPLSRLALYAEKSRNFTRAENASGLETTARHEISRLERGLVILEITVGIAPLLGLVGTIYGLIALFAELGASGMGDNARLANGIAFALRATLLGLITAIPSLVAWSYYNKKIETMGAEMAALCEGFLRQLYHQHDAGEMAERPAAARS